jgi:hypothetical protein
MKRAFPGFSLASLAVLAIQLALVSSVAGIYLYQRWTCPRVWTRAVSVDPETLMRGRYLSLRLTVDGCQSTLPSAKQAAFGRNVDGSANQSPYAVASPQTVTFPARLSVRDNKLLAVALAPQENPARGQMVLASPGKSCEQMTLALPVSFYVSEQTVLPQAANGAETWIEVTVPSLGPPRPLQLALKEQGVWKPLAIQ